jgi:4-hydroxybenzoate polyprenyltransferase
MLGRSNPSRSESAADPGPASPEALLCVDLDGTLISCDLLWEGLFALIGKQPRAALSVPVWAVHGRAFLRSRIADLVSHDVETLPYVPEVLAYLKQERQRGRKLILAADSDPRWARAVADHLGLFDHVLTTGRRGVSKVEAIRAEFGDVAVECLESGHRSSQSKGGLLRLLRPHQWAKNLLLFLPIVTAHRLNDARVVFDVGLAFLAFCAMASSVYIFNDLLDLGSDRRHPVKRRRPLASGQVSIPGAIAAAGGLFLVSILLSVALPLYFIEQLELYVLAASAYSLFLKRKLVVDVLCLAGLYTLRISAGGAAAVIPISPWLQAFSIFFFLSLAFLKRYAELIEHSGDPTFEPIVGRGYMPVDLSMIQVLGPTSGYLAVLVLSLYISSPDVVTLYRHPSFLWLLCPILLYWITRVWFLAHRRQLTDDLVLFAIKDRIGYLAAVVMLVVLALASYPGSYSIQRPVARPPAVSENIPRPKWLCSEIPDGFVLDSELTLQAGYST